MGLPRDELDVTDVVAVVVAEDMHAAPQLLSVIVKNGQARVE